jgi:hypothetical protein
VSVAKRYRLDSGQADELDQADDVDGVPHDGHDAHDRALRAPMRIVSARPARDATVEVLRDLQCCSPSRSHSTLASPAS